MLSALMLSGFLLGLAGSPHCVAMCGGLASMCLGRGAAPGSPYAWLWFNAARVLSYGMLGVTAGLLFQGLAQTTQVLRAAQPLWVLLHAGIAAWGAWLVITARQPALSALVQDKQGVLEAAGSAQPVKFVRSKTKQPWQRGLLWGAMPCGLLYSALLSAALAATPLYAGAVMVAFGLGTSIAFAALPIVAALMRRAQHIHALRALNADGRLAVRAGGALLCALSITALFTDVQTRTGGLMC
jgi:sulfite exporter TauE/SafE